MCIYLYIALPEMCLGDDWLPPGFLLVRDSAKLARIWARLVAGFVLLSPWSLSSSSSASASLTGRNEVLLAGTFVRCSPLGSATSSDASKSARLLLSLRFVRKKESLSGRSGERGLITAPWLGSSVSEEMDERGVFDAISSSVVESWSFAVVDSSSLALAVRVCSVHASAMEVLIASISLHY